MARKFIEPLREFKEKAKTKDPRREAVSCIHRISISIARSQLGVSGTLDRGAR